MRISFLVSATARSICGAVRQHHGVVCRPVLRFMTRQDPATTWWLTSLGFDEASRAENVRRCKEIFVSTPPMTHRWHLCHAKKQ